MYDNATGVATNTPKAYGKSITPAQLPEGIAKFFPVAKLDAEAPSEGTSGLPAPLLELILDAIQDEVKEIRDIIAELELRIVGGSLLIVYEGDAKRAQEGVDILDEDDEEDEEDEDEDSQMPVPFVVKLIDFAHTRQAPGEGPDTGVLLGMDTVLKLLDGRLKEIA